MIRSLTSTCIVLLCFFASVATLPRKKFYRALGEQIEFKAIHEMGEIKSIVWKFTKAGETEKVVDWEPEYDTEEFGQFKSRVFLNILTGDLTVRDLTAQDTGHFVVDINSKELETSYDLHVMAKVSKPTIEVELPKIAEDVRYLTCKANTSTEQTLTWKDGDGTQLGTESHLTVNRTYKMDKKYFCILKNPVSEERSNPVREEDIFRPDPVPIWLIVLLIFIAIIVIPLCCIIPCLYACNRQVHDSLSNRETSCIKGYRRLLDRIIGFFPNCAVKYPPEKNNEATSTHRKDDDQVNPDAESGRLLNQVELTNGEAKPEENRPENNEDTSGNEGAGPHGNESNNVGQSGDDTRHPGKSDPQTSENAENKKAENGPGNDAGLGGNEEATSTHRKDDDQVNPDAESGRLLNQVELTNGEAKPEENRPENNEDTSGNEGSHL